ncbi:SGNH/GDSL hydrolase family protein [Psychrobacter okhotskensis]|uniref:SGNH/GDSL hydrolase family protein n=1 Tax=Psychrobacter okhotskensis TaxID=212403 RepID=UPI001565E066|nr:SGNH/GDSL hydrolase family protein [Psychrobacter okhotskensis]NRD71121.1 SGNH/GDSL hydrolase family protein [Psychrobacter okhotskensis]
MRDSILFVGDSLTEHMEKLSYTTPLIKRLAPMYGGMGDFGYLSLSATHTKMFASDQQVVVTRTSPETVIHMWGNSDRKWGISPYKYSPDGQGFLVQKSNAETIFVSTKRPLKCTKVRLFYLKQPGGCKFGFGFSSQKASERILIHTDSKVEQLSVIEIDTEYLSEKLVIQLDRSGGKFAAYGVQFVDENRENGITYNVLARSGVALCEHNELVSIETYYKHLEPTIAVINIGTNDGVRATGKQSPVEFFENLQIWIDRLRSVCPNCRIYIVEPNHPEYYEKLDHPLGILLKKYTLVRKAIVEENKNIFYIDIPTYTGNYLRYKTSNWMYDGVHPNAVGKVVIANATFDYMMSVGSSLSYDTVNSNSE